MLSTLKPHRTEKERQHVSLVEKILTAGNEKVDEVAKEGAILDGRLKAQARVSTVRQEREEVFAALQYAASFCCLVEELKDREELEPKSKEKRISVRQRIITRSGV